jgi:hypothetical protein
MFKGKITNFDISTRPRGGLGTKLALLRNICSDDGVAVNLNCIPTKVVV